jgi:hypothetical protein
VVKVLITTHYTDQTTRRQLGDLESVSLSPMQLWPSNVREITFEKITDEEAKVLLEKSSDER